MKRILSMMLAMALVAATSVVSMETVASAALGESGVSFSVTFEDGTTRDVEVIPHYGLAKEVLPLVNAERTAAGLAPFVWDELLEEAVLQRAAEASVAGDAKNSQHIRPDGTSWDTVLPADRPYGSYGENLAGGMRTANAAVTAWMGSAGHRRNIMSDEYLSMAVACVEDENGTYHWVQLFGMYESDGGGDYGFTVTFQSNGGSAVASQGVATGGLVTRPSNPTRNGYSFGGWYKDAALTTPWNFSTDKVTADVTLYAKWSSNNSSGGSGGGGGSSSGGSSSRDTYGATGGSTPFSSSSASTSSNVGSDGAVTASAIKSEIEKAAASASGNLVTVRAVNAKTVSPATLQTMAASAVSKTVVMHADTTSADGKSVQVRMYVEPAKLAGAAKELKVAGYTEAGKTASVKAQFEKWFGNTVSVVRLEQQGSLGARLQIAAKVDLTGLDTGSLVLYTYDRASNRYYLIQNPAYYIDNSGFLHFYTENGGDIIITDSPLAKK